MTAALLTPEHDDSIAFLNWFAPNDRWVLTALAPDRGPRSTETFVTGREDEVRQWLVRHGDCNLYFQVNPPTRDLAKKSKREDIAALAWLHVDLDPVAGADIDEERARILAVLESPPEGIPRPTAINFSGGGYQAFWRLSDPLQLDGTPKTYEEAKLFNLALEQQLGGDDCHNVDRIMRLPGTINWPDARKARKGRVPTLARAIWSTPTAYPISEFRKAIPARGQPLGLSLAPVPTGSPNVAVTLDEINDLDQWSVPERVKLIITAGQADFSNAGKDCSRSGWVWDVACQLVRAGVPDGVVIGIFTDSRWKISQSVLEKPRPYDYIARQIENARVTVSGLTNWPDPPAKEGSPPRSTYSNTRAALLRLGLNCAHDVFRDRQLVNGHAVQDYQGEVSDHGCTLLRQAIIDHFDFDPGKEHVRDAVHQLALQNAYDPVLDNLLALHWDGVTRTGRWLHIYLEPMSI